jgi:hypothetical protein
VKGILTEALVANGGLMIHLLEARRQGKKPRNRSILLG